MAAARHPSDQVAAVDRGDAEPLPFGERPAVIRAGQARIEARGQENAPSPGLVTVPAGEREVICDRGEDILAPMPDVAAAVSAVAHGELQIARWHELALTHGARPGTQHVLGADPALIDDLECSHQLLAEIAAAPAIVGERCQRGDFREIAHALSVIALDAQSATMNRGCTPKRCEIWSRSGRFSLSRCRPSSMRCCDTTRSMYCSKVRVVSG